MRACARWWRSAALLALTLAAVRAARSDQDFEFDDDAHPEQELGPWGSAAPAPHHRPRRYIYEPHNPLCRSLECKKREVCLLRDAFTALCATKKEILRKGDVIVAGGGGGGGQAQWGDDDGDVFYDADGGAGGARCVGCGRGGGARGQFVCGSDNRTYSSLCRLDLHNCVRRAAPPVRPHCRGFCPCRPPRPPRPPHPAQRELHAAGSEGCALDKMANRLLDWFSVLMDEAGATPPPPDGFPTDCKPEVRWMFAHLDTDGDGQLSAANLYALRHEPRERCLRPFLATCGRRGVGRAAWCGCMRRAARPCAALARRGHASSRPACDARGFYLPRQCHAALGVCWCVDAHGQELPHSRTRGAPSCGEGAPADDEDGAGAGSGDAALQY